MYYLRTRPAVDAIKFTVDQLAIKESVEEEDLAARTLSCSLENKDACAMCSG